MLVIPVIDLLGGAVVHARRGDRANYQPIQSTLTPSSEPVAVVSALRTLAPFRQLYVADLDAIQRRGPHHEVVEQLTREFPDLEIWIDAGIDSAQALSQWQTLPVRPIVGSESLPDIATWHTLRTLAPLAVLSLDTRGETRMGPPTLFESSEAWPGDVIVMTLDRVGSGQGPALENLTNARALSKNARLIAAGGVRNADDLETLKGINVYAALVATALHDGRLDQAALHRFLGD